MSEEIKNFKDIKQIFASVLDQLKTWSDGQPIQNDINQQDVANAPLDPSRIDDTKPGGAGNHTKEDKFDYLAKQMTACMNACMAMASQMEMHGNRLNYHSSRIDNTNDRIQNVDDRHSKAMNEHKKGHLPPANSPEEMTRAVKNLGLSGSYEVNKRQIFASKDLFEIKK